MSALVLNEQSLKELERIRSYAESHVVDPERLMRILSKEEPPVGDDPNHFCLIPFGFKIVFSLEDQPVGRIRHCSISCSRLGKAPSPQVFQLVMPYLGFTTPLEDCKLWFEECPVDGGINEAINIVQL